MNRLIAPLAWALMLAVAVTASAATWSNVHSDLADGATSAVEGPDAVYTVVWTKRGPWTASFGLANRVANLEGYPIRVYSADVVTFHPHFVASGHSGRSSHMVLKFRLSEPVRRVTWALPGHSRHISPGVTFAARYSTDGKNWSDAYVYLPGRSDAQPPPATMDFDPPTRILYVGWFAEVPQGRDLTGYWNTGETGTFTFVASDGGEAAAEALGPEDANDPAEPLHGSRFIPNSFFATTTHGVSERTVTLMNSLNMRGARVDFLRALLESTPGQYWFEPDNPVIRNAECGIAANINLLPILHPPAYVFENPGVDSDRLAEEFAFAIASKYRGRITHWQIGNEPDMSVWKERYVRYLKACHRGLKRADPANRVVLAGFSGLAPLHLKAVYRYGGKGHFDIVASHAYTRPRPPEEGYLKRIGTLARVMREHGDDLPIWVTEMGWNGIEPSMLEYLRARNAGYRSYACTEEDQARGLARLYLLSATVPRIERVFFFHLSQEAKYTDHHHENADYFMGVVGPGPLPGSLRFKDAYFSVKTVIRMINETRYVGRIDLGPRIRALVFDRDEDRLVALWSLNDDVTLKLRDASVIAGVTSMVGSPVLVQENTLHLSGRPIYVAASPGNIDDLKAQIAGGEISGPGDVGVSVAVDRQRTHPRAPVLDVQITNQRRRALSAPPLHLEVAAPWRAKVPLIHDRAPLEPGQTRHHSVPLAGPQGDGEVVVDLSTTWALSPATAKKPKVFRYLIVPPKPKRFRADGDLSEWVGVAPVELGADPRDRELNGWRGMEDCSVRWYCAWDDHGLYCAADVRDDGHHQPCDPGTTERMWRADSIQVAVDTGGDGTTYANMLSFDEVNDVEFGLALGDDGKVLVHFWSNPKGQIGPIDLKDAAILRDDDAGTTRYEVRIPWEVMGITDSPSGQWMGLNFIINDNDGHERRGWIEWSPGIGYEKNASHFPKIWLR